MPRWPVRTFADRFWGCVDRRGPNDCWDWQGARDRDGYGVVRGPRGEWWRAHRAAYALTQGPIPAGLYVLHSCDRPPCCNPAHLSAGDQLENIEQRERRLVRLHPAKALNPKVEGSP